MPAFKILTIDDCVISRKTIITAFAPFNCIVSEAENGLEGLSAIYHNKPDLILLNLNMPIMNGLEMLEKLKRDDSIKDIPVIMLTSESSKTTVMQILKLGVNDYIAKPFDNTQLIERVKKYLPLKPKTTSKYFSVDEGIYVVQLPNHPSPERALEIKSQLSDYITHGANRFVIDLTKGEPSIMTMKLLAVLIARCEKANVKIAVMAGYELAIRLKGYQEIAGATIFYSIEAAKRAFEDNS